MFFRKTRNTHDYDSLKERMNYLENFLDTQVDGERKNNGLQESIRDEIRRIKRKINNH